jgi:hypothetical protein
MYVLFGILHIDKTVCIVQSVDLFLIILSTSDTTIHMLSVNIIIII